MNRYLRETGWRSGKDRSFKGKSGGVETRSQGTTQVSLLMGVGVAPSINWA